MSTYTNNENIYFLNDRNIAQTLEEVDTSKVNPIPSLGLVNSLSITTTQISSDLVRDLSSYANDLSASLCATVDLRRTTDKEELSAQANKDFVHVSGDVVNGRLAINNNLSVAGSSNFDSNVIIKENLIQGAGSSVNADVKNGIALGISSVAAENYSFVWNGYQGKSYSSKDHGTFNINPEDGTEGIFIGDNSLCSLLSSEIELTAKTLREETDVISSSLCSAVEQNRKDDKEELSGVLSTYTNVVKDSLSGTIEQNRKDDKEELSGVLSSYSNSLCASISSTVANAGYALFNNFEFSYDPNSHQLVLTLFDKNEVPRTLSVDATDFIKNRIVRDVEIVETDQGKMLRLYFEKKDEGDIFVDIPLDQLATIYQKGTGIDITLDDNKHYSISVINYNQITSDVKNLKDSTDAISNDLELSARNLDANVKQIQAYVNALSTNDGIIEQLSDYGKALSDHFRYYVDPAIGTMSSDISEIDSRLTAAEEDMAAVKNNVQVISNDISTIYKQINHDMSFAGHINIDFSCILNNTDQPWVSANKGNVLSSIFEYYNLAEKGYVKNGLVCHVNYINVPDHPSDDMIAKMRYATSDNFELKKDDFIVVHSHQDDSKVPLQKISPETVYTLAHGLSADYYKLKTSTRDNYVWLSGDNNNTLSHAISGNNEFLGTNSFEDVSISNEMVQQLSANAISAENLVASSSLLTDVSVENDLSIGNNLTVCGEVDLLSSNVTIKDEVIVSNYKLKINNSCEISSGLIVEDILTASSETNAAIIANLSAGTLSANWIEVKDSATGYSLFNLSTDLSNKIWIEDRVNKSISGTSDLSIVKIRKEEYDELVANDNATLCTDTLYIVDSDYIDAYGQTISNLAMDKDDPTYMVGIAATKPYVDQLSTDLSNEMKALSTSLTTEIMQLSNVLSAISHKIKQDEVLSSGITNGSNISTILSATVLMFSILSSL